MKKGICILLLLHLAIGMWAPVVVNSRYQPISYDEMVRPLQEATNAHNQAVNAIYRLQNSALKILQMDELDDIARSEFKQDYQNIVSLLEYVNKYGIYAGIWDDIKRLNASMNNHAERFIARDEAAYEAQKRAEELEAKKRRELEEQRRREQVQREMEEASKPKEWSGTGFALKNGYIVTNYHVIEDATSIVVKGIQGNFNIGYKAKVVATDKANDLAIIKITDQRFKGFGTIPYKVKKPMSEVGAYVWTLGYPLTQVMGNEVKFTDGKISSRSGFDGEVNEYQISVPIQSGNSGGPLFDANGNITGITSAGLNREISENVNYAIKASYLCNLVEKKISPSILPQGTAMQGQALTQKIKLAKKFVYMILCSSSGSSDNTSAYSSNKPVSSSVTSSNSSSTYGRSNSRQNYTETVFGINMQMIWVEGGSFLMGCTSEQGSDCYDNVRRVTLDGFYIGMLEVTQSQWEKVMGTSVYQQRNKANPERPMRGVGSDYPMYYVSWDEAMEFCRLLSNKTGRTYTLPTEAQWEYAARGGSRNEGTKYAGSNMLDAVGWYRDNSGSSTHRCGTKCGNALGIYDMSGNVWEWCKDWYSISYLSYDTNNPVGPSSGSLRVIRGGGWDYDAGYCRVAYRFCGSPSARYNNFGFRVVCLP